jgi:hypothetical protein
LLVLLVLPKTTQKFLVQWTHFSANFQEFLNFEIFYHFQV